MKNCVMLEKLFISLKSIGFKKTIVKLIFIIFNYLSFKSYKRKKFEKNLFKTKSVEERFDKIYSTNYWLDKGKLEIQHFKQMYLFSKLQIKNVLLNT